MKIIESLKELLKGFFDAVGISPIYGLTIILLLFTAFRIRNLKNWNSLSSYEKRWDIMLLTGVILLLIGSILNYFRSD